MLSKEELSKIGQVLVNATDCKDKLIDTLKEECKENGGLEYKAQEDGVEYLVKLFLTEEDELKVRLYSDGKYRKTNDIGVFPPWEVFSIYCNVHRDEILDGCKEEYDEFLKTKNK